MKGFRTAVALWMVLVLVCACAPSAQQERQLADIEGVTFDDVTAFYDGTMHEITLSGTLPDGVSVTYANNRAADAGTYRATAKLSGEGYRERVLTATLTIQPALFTGVGFKDARFVYDGRPHLPALTGLPAGTETAYLCDGRPTEGIVKPGSYSVTVTLSNPNYTEATLSALLTVRRRADALSLGGAMYYSYGGVMRFDGQTSTRIYEYTPNAFADAGGTLCFVTAYALYALEGEEIVKIADGGGKSLAYDGRYLYVAAEDGGIRRVSLAGEETKFSPEEAEFLAYAGGYLWLCGQDGLKCISVDTGKCTAVLQDGEKVHADAMKAVFADGDPYLLLSTASGILRYGIVDRTFSLLTADMGASFAVIGQTVYYLTDGELPTSEVRRVPLFAAAAAEGERVYQSDAPILSMAELGGRLAVAEKDALLLDEA